jgi:hypothetical protein
MMTENKLKRKYLYKFLKKNGLLAEYVKNIEEQHPYTPQLKVFRMKGTRESLLRLIRSSRFDSISNGFTWMGTRQGHKFWCELEDKFEREFTKILFDYPTEITL